jgi:GxxExxY protein
MNDNKGQHDDQQRRHDDHEAVEEHEIQLSSYRLRVPSPLTPAAESIMTRVIGCAVAVHKELGPGFIESIYQKAMCVEFQSRRLAFEVERPITVSYRGVPLSGQRVDLVVEGLIVVELKAVIRLDEIHRSQVVSYLRTMGLRGGLLINFRTSMIKYGIKRVVI